MFRLSTEHYCIIVIVQSVVNQKKHFSPLLIVDIIW